MEATPKPANRSSARAFFFRGLAVLLPSILTIWILWTAYNFVVANIAGPINQGIRVLAVQYWPYPAIGAADLEDARADMALDERRRWQGRDAQLMFDLKRKRIEAWWTDNHHFMDLIGLVVAVMLIYMVGVLLGVIGRGMVHRGERFLQRVPIIRFVYPSVKQVTDFFFGSSENQLKFSRVVAVEYPRRGIWSMGLMTGDTMQTIQDAAGVECYTVFIPSSPTPFTGYVITVPVTEVVDINITIDEALKFVISGGVIVPTSQLIHKPSPQLPADAVPEDSIAASPRP